MVKIVDCLLKVILLYGICWADPSTNPLGLKAVQGKKYFIGGFVKVNQELAIEACNHYDMELVSIEDEGKRQIVTNLTAEWSEHYWTSGNRLNDHKTWIWANGVPMISARWGRGEPNNKNGNEWCVSIFDGNLMDENCNNEYFYICESIEKNSINTLQYHITPRHLQTQMSRKCPDLEPIVNFNVQICGNDANLSYNITSLSKGQGNVLTNRNTQKCTYV